MPKSVCVRACVHDAVFIIVIVTMKILNKSLLLVGRITPLATMSDTYMKVSVEIEKHTPTKKKKNNRGPMVL